MLSQVATRIQPSQTLWMNRKAKELKACGKAIFNLAAGEPYWDTPEPIKDAARKALQDGFTKYGPTQGFLELREKVTAYVQEYFGASYSPEEVLVSAGAKQSLYLALMALLNPGDRVLIPFPSWVSYLEMVKMCGAQPLLVPSSFEQNFVLQPELFPEEAKEVKAIILNNPCNPTGSLLSEEQLAKICQFAQEKNCFIIADEIYEAFVLADRSFVSTARLTASSMRDRTIIVFGVSKTFSMTGWRIGFALGPKPLIQAMTRLQDHQSSCANAIAQKAAEKALALGREPALAHIPEIKQTTQQVLQKLKSSRVPIRVIPPSGAFYLFPDLSYVLGKRFQGKKIETMADFCLSLLETEGVSCVPGDAFLEKRGVRISLAQRQEEVLEGIDRLLSFIEKLDEA